MVRENGLSKVYSSVRQNPPNRLRLANTRARGPGVRIRNCGRRSVSIKFVYNFVCSESHNLLTKRCSCGFEFFSFTRLCQITVILLAKKLTKFDCDLKENKIFKSY